MTPLFTRLQLGQRRDLLVVDAPASFAAELSALPDVTITHDPAVAPSCPFTLAFVQTTADVDAVAGWLSTVTGDAVVWLAYPKATSKRYRCTFNRDNGWDAIGALGFEAVRQVAIDEDWSALRFRRVAYIQSLTRAPSRASSPAGRARATARRAEEER